MPPYESLYGIKCCTPLCWSEICERKLIGPEMVQYTADKTKNIKDRLKIFSNIKYSHANLIRRDIEYTI